MPTFHWIEWNCWLLIQLAETNKTYRDKWNKSSFFFQKKIENSKILLIYLPNGSSIAKIPCLPNWDVNTSIDRPVTRIEILRLMRFGWMSSAMSSINLSFTQSTKNQTNKQIASTLFYIRKISIFFISITLFTVFSINQSHETVVSFACVQHSTINLCGVL